MSKKIVFITSSFPYGKSEVWAINEINSLMALGNKITIIPRSGQGKIINQDAIKFSANLIDLPYINFKRLNKETLETKNKFNKLKLEFYNREKINYDQTIR